MKTVRKRKRSRSNSRRREPFLRRAGRSLLRAAAATLVISLVAFLGYSGWWVYKKAVTTPYLAVHTIEITGNKRVSKDDLLRLSGIMDGENIYSFTARDVIANIKKNPWVEDVIVKRRLPDTVRFIIRERRPAALVKLDKLYVMDSRGVIFKKCRVEDGLDLPVVTGLTEKMIGGDDGIYETAFLGLLNLLERRKGFNASMVSEINVDPVYGLTVNTVDEGVRVRLGFSGFEDKLKMFEKVLELRKGSLRGIETVDLNNGNDVMVRFNSDLVKGGGRT